MNHPHANQGFVLITGLLFLIVITLLALSTLGSTTLQEKMASNLREKARALEAADAALRDGEARLAQFVTYQPTGSNYSYDPTPQLPSNGDEGVWHLWPNKGPLAAADADEGFFDLVTWGVGNLPTSAPRPETYRPPFDASLVNAPRLYIEETDNFSPQDLNPDTAATGRGSFIYRVTSRAQGGTAAAIAITQSQYLKRY